MSRLWARFNAVVQGLFGVASLYSLFLYLKTNGLHPYAIVYPCYTAVMGGVGWALWVGRPWGRRGFWWLSLLSLGWSILVLKSMGILGPFMTSFYPAAPLPLGLIRIAYSRAPFGLQTMAGVVGLYAFQVLVLLLDGANLIAFHRRTDRIPQGKG